MFNSNIKFLVQSIEKSMVIEKNNIFYQKFNNFFDREMLEHINLQIDSLEKEKLMNQTDIEREKSKDSERLIKELMILFSHSAVRNCLGQKYKMDFRLSSLDIWYDYPGYFLSPHVDNDSIKMSIQIYLGKDKQPGTVLFDSLDATKHFDKFEFNYNSGYSMLHSGSSFHGVEYPVKQGVRKSLYVRYR
jgi:hypothetical protein